jgi:hypothetical protein
VTAENALGTEEDLRSRILLPYLVALGLDANQIRLEQSFKLQLGRTAVEIGRGVSRTQVGGRLDVLVTNSEGENLFVVELKGDEETLTQADRDQGVSYARLLDQIAPFVLLTNGKETHIYDTVTKQRLNDSEFPQQSGFWRNGRALLGVDDIRIRYEALRHFLGYSVENVRLFSVAQQSLRMEPLRGASAIINRKYTPELYIHRSGVREAVTKFLDGPGTVFALVGESGVGKTNEVCALAEWIAEQHVALFFSAGALHSSITETLAEEFNWHFSDQLSPPDVLRRLADTARNIDRRVVIVIDALDEATLAAFEQSTNDFAQRLRNFEGHVKFICSAKTGEWDRFVTLRGDPSPLLLALDTSWQEPADGVEATGGIIEPRPFLLSRFSDEELATATQKYAELFAIPPTGLRGPLREHCRIPFVLRVVSEVYSGQDVLPTDISEAELLRTWLNRKLSRMSNPGRARAELEAVARAVYQRSTASSSAVLDADQVPEAAIRELTGSPTLDLVGNELVAHDVLTRYVDEDGRASLSFYFGRLRDYIIARHVLALDQMPANEFRGIVDILLGRRILQGVLFWHIRTAPNEHRAVLTDIMQGRAALFLDTYERILDELIPGLKTAIDPWTAGEIGIAYEVDDHGLRYFGLYPVGERNSSRILQLTPHYDGRRNPFMYELLRLGGKTAQGGGNNFSNSDPAEAACTFALKGIREATDRGMLNEAASSVLSAEAVIAIANQHREVTGIKRPPSLQQDLFAYERVHVREIFQELQAHFGSRFYDNEWANEQIRGKTEYAVIDEISGTASVTYPSEIRRECRLRAKQEAAGGHHFPIPRVHGEEDLSYLSDLLSKLLAKNVVVLDPVLPPPDTPPPPHSDYRPHWVYSDAQMSSLIATLFHEAVSAYGTLLTVNFPSLQHLFRGTRRLSAIPIIVYYKPESIFEKSDWGNIEYTFIPTEEEDRTVQVYIEPEDPPIRYNRDGTVSLNGRTIQASGMTASAFQGILSPYNAPGFRAKTRHLSARRAPIRALVYRWIKQDLDELTDTDIGAVLSPRIR